VVMRAGVHGVEALSPVLRKNSILVALDMRSPTRDNRQKRPPISEGSLGKDTFDELHASPRTVPLYAAYVPR
jgi:hypothetical protein